ncbi:hypothetical protein C8N32_10490 [Rhodovulum imhoffii]|uniref:CAAX prenyl protease 2/Lysostaphin resistance protein A-like domain-containing protein n=1 Tax=Rhodovulum imhoffii TaxID=365340 RepID=A0A2T5BU26_9RHOB|nr:type II CAAX endopeptidase family protein [Rhodovulum imhoffii]PTN02979.1 hypothetical protein C8N32_10490 [Rhodovulum imhoffii]
MPSPEFDTYIAPARLYAEPWRLLTGLGVILLIYLGGFSIMLVGAYPVLGPLGYFGWMQGLTTLETPGHVLFLLASFLGMGLGVLIATPALHYREPGSLFGALRDTLRGFFRTLLVLVPIYGLLTGAAIALLPPETNLAPAQWLRLLPVAVALLFIQTTSEELLFRGYLQQQLAARFAARIVWMGLPALFFTALHFNPDAGSNLPLILVSTFLFALSAANLTERTGNLGAAMGWHFVNNFNALMIISLKGSITGLSLFVTPFDISDTAIAPYVFVFDLIVLVVVWRILRAVL